MAGFRHFVTIHKMKDASMTSSRLSKRHSLRKIIAFLKLRFHWSSCAFAHIFTKDQIETQTHLLTILSVLIREQVEFHSSFVPSCKSNGHVVTFSRKPIRQSVYKTTILVHGNVHSLQMYGTSYRSVFMKGIVASCLISARLYKQREISKSCTKRISW